MDPQVRKVAGDLLTGVRPITNNADYDPLMEMADEAQCVLIGEASHGTDEFYETRGELTRWLIQQKGFHAIALEADWPDSFRVHRFVTVRSEDPSASNEDEAELVPHLKKEPTVWVVRSCS